MTLLSKSCMQRNFMYEFRIKILNISLFPGHMLYLIYVFYNNRYRGKMLESNTCNHAFGLNIKFKDIYGLLCETILILNIF